MRCRNYEKWISDALDGALGERQKALLDLHLGKCPSCRAYHSRLSGIQREAVRLRKPAVAPLYWEELSSTVRSKLEAAELRRRQSNPVRLAWRWAWGAAALIGAVVLGLLLRPVPGPAIDHDVFTFEACLSRLDQEIGDDAELAGNFNLVLLSSLRKDFSSARLEENPVFSEDSLFWESLSEEEWQILEQELKKELKS
jgi:hypothetical protein